MGVPMWALTATVLFLGINGSIASEASIIVVPSLAAAAFASVGMHPIAGLLAGYAATNAGFTACLIPAGTDVLLSGVTETTAQLMDPSFTVNATCNWYFMIASTFMLTIVGVWVNKKFIVPRLGTYKGGVEKTTDITPAEKKGLKAAGLFSIAYIALFAILTIPSNGILRGEDGGVLSGALITGLVPMMMMLGFSPDCRYFVTYRADLRNVKPLAVIESCGGDAEHLRPIVHEYACPFAVDSDDEMRCIELFLGDVEAGTLTKLSVPPYVHPVFTQPDKSFVKWLDDSSGFYFTWFDRAYHIGRLYFTDVTTGKTTLRVEDINNTFHNLGAFNLLDGFGAYQFSNFVTSDRRYAFWQSERSGYAHLYRYNEQGECEGDLFGSAHSTLIVQKLIRVDERTEKIYFMANNIPECSDPLFYSLYVIGFDGSNLTRLTPEDANHVISMGENAFADTYSRVDLPPVSVLRRLDGTWIAELERADISELMDSGYIMPERFTVKADDGVTDLYGILIRPADFDPNKKYPLIDYVYGGAQLYNVPRDFTWDNVQDREIFGGLQEYAQLGFVGVIIDGRGTPGRGKVFHDFSYQRIHGCAGLDDHPGAIRRLTEQYPFIDLDRVGIWGNSGGGYATVSALLKYGDLYKVGVASSGNFDQRVYENSWTERYYGQYDPSIYQHGDITAMADRLTGKLLLACGCMDDNVTIWQTMRLCDEFTRHNKDYDLMVLPRVNHNVPSDLYFMRRKMDYFVRHLLGEEPPKEFTFDCM